MACNTQQDRTKLSRSRPGLLFDDGAAGPSGVPHDAGRRQPAAPRPGRELAATGDVPSAARVRASPARRRRRRYAAGQRMHARSWNTSESRVDSRRVAAALGNDAAGRTAVAAAKLPGPHPSKRTKLTNGKVRGA